MMSLQISRWLFRWTLEGMSVAALNSIIMERSSPCPLAMPLYSHPSPISTGAWQWRVATDTSWYSGYIISLGINTFTKRSN